jgi:hypothetical protein
MVTLQLHATLGSSYRRICQTSLDRRAMNYSAKKKLLALNCNRTPAVRPLISLIVLGYHGRSMKLTIPCIVLRHELRTLSYCRSLSLAARQRSSLYRNFHQSSTCTSTTAWGSVTRWQWGGYRPLTLWWRATASSHGKTTSGNQTRDGPTNVHWIPGSGRTLTLLWCTVRTRYQTTLGEHVASWDTESL